MYDPDKVDLPEHRSLNLENKPWWHKKLYGEYEKIGFDQYTNPEGSQKVSRIQQPTESELRQITANYYGMIAFLDDGVGRVMSAIQDLDLEDDTVIVYTTDHGELLGDMNLLLDRADLGERGIFFRLQTGPFPNRVTAKDMCSQLKAAALECIVTER